MNGKAIIASLNYIDTELLERSEKRAPKGRIVYRYLAAAAALLLVFGAAFGIAKAAGVEKLPEGTASADNSGAEAVDTIAPTGTDKYAFLADTTVPEDAVLPPSQMGGEGAIFPGYDKLRDFKQLYEDSDAVCIVTIRDWLGESEISSWYEASVERVYKGDPGDTIVLYQYGTSKRLFDDMPLFTYGDKLLIGVRHQGSFPYENAYFVTGQYSTLTYIALAEDGEAYVIDRNGYLEYQTRLQCPELRFTTYEEDRELRGELFENMAKYDEYTAELYADYFNDYAVHKTEWIRSQTMIPRIYLLEELEAFFEGQE